MLFEQTRLAPVPVYYANPQTSCDVCHGAIGLRFVDGRMRRGKWAIMCPRCNDMHGTGVGDGRGQVFTRQDDGRWLKTA